MNIKILNLQAVKCISYSLTQNFRNPLKFRKTLQMSFCFFCAWKNYVFWELIHFLYNFFFIGQRAQPQVSAATRAIYYHQQGYDPYFPNQSLATTNMHPLPQHLPPPPPLLPPATQPVKSSHSSTAPKYDPNNSVLQQNSEPTYAKISQPNSSNAPVQQLQKLQSSKNVQHQFQKHIPSEGANGSSHNNQKSYASYMVIRVH